MSPRREQRGLSPGPLPFPGSDPGDLIASGARSERTMALRNPREGLRHGWLGALALTLMSACSATPANNTPDASIAPRASTDADAGAHTGSVAPKTETDASSALTRSEEVSEDEAPEDTLDAAGPAPTEAAPAEPEGGDAHHADVTPERACLLSPGALPAHEGDFIAQGETVSATREWCKGALHASAGAEGSTLEVKVESLGEHSAIMMRVEDLLGAAIVEWQSVSPGDALSFSPPRSGEVFIRLEPVEVAAASHGYELGVSCVSGCDREFTRYPVVLMHGMAGTETYINLLDYWFQLDDHLSSRGFNLQIREVESFQATNVRAEQWIAHLEAMVAAGVGRRFNLIGHSQGGIDARLVAASKAMTGRIQSVVTVSSPHRGSPAAQAATGTFDLFPISGVVLDGLTGLLGGLIGLTGDDLVAQIGDFTPEAMEAFNASYPNLEGVYYASYAGLSCGALDLVCQWSNKGEIVDPLFAISHTFVTLAAGDNDGLVPVHSATWGDFQGTIPADHMDAVGQIADFINLSFNHKAFYLDELRRLATLGL